MTTPVIASASKWGKAFWADWIERVGTSFLYALITLLTNEATVDLSFETIWPIVGLPVLLAAIKGLLANMKDASTGASLLGGPPGPVLDDKGQIGMLGALGVGLALVGLVLWVATYLTTLGAILLIAGIVLLVVDVASTARRP